MPFEIDQVEPDVPIFGQDFQDAAIHQGYHQSTGMRLFRDLNFRGWFYDAAVQRHRGLPLRSIDRARLGNMSEAILDVYYFGDTTDDPQAMSLNGLRKVIGLGLVDDIIPIRQQRSDVRQRILGEVIANKLNEVE